MMWIIWTIVFVAFFMLLAQFISRLTGEKFAGLAKVIPSEQKDFTDDTITENTIERLSGSNMPYFENLLLIELKTPEQLQVSWKMDDNYFVKKLNDYHQENVDSKKGLLRLSFTGGGRHIYEDFPVRLDESPFEPLIHAPGSTVVAELGFYTAEHNFITVLTSNQVVIPR